MSLESFLGREKNFLDDTPEQYRGLKLSHPILTIRDMVRLREANHPEVILKDIDILFPVDGDGDSLKKAMTSIFRQAEQYIAEGATLLVLTDKGVDEDHIPVPSL